MLISDDYGYIARALAGAECLLVNQAIREPQHPDVVVGNNARFLREVRIALSVARGERVTVAELAPFLGRHWVVVRQRRADRPHYARCGAEQRQILARELADAERMALEARFATVAEGEARFGTPRACALVTPSAAPRESAP